ncbi:MAG: hypothetical protein GX895_04150 [Clostridiales bacterium]|uniref:hypothetical protein n=1 Tax=Clostridium sp. N3C TaxID=1776758 RepID=UPI001178CD8A|nr:hypothetical protein [Clostridium sp. N3C]NLZ47971.1 hypothetical protein [Clostridiales bacterium]
MEAIAPIDAGNKIQAIAPIEGGSGSSFSASIKIGTAGYGVVDGKSNGVYYTLSPGTAIVLIKSMNGATNSDILLYRGLTKVGEINNITKTGTYKFNITTTSSNYWLKIYAWGASGNTASISGNIY